MIIVVAGSRVDASTDGHDSTRDKRRYRLSDRYAIV